MRFTKIIFGLTVVLASVVGLYGNIIALRRDIIWWHPPMVFSVCVGFCFIGGVALIVQGLVKNWQGKYALLSGRLAFICWGLFLAGGSCYLILAGLLDKMLHPRYASDMFSAPLYILFGVILLLGSLSFWIGCRPRAPLSDSG